MWWLWGPVGGGGWVGGWVGVGGWMGALWIYLMAHGGGGLSVYCSV